MLSTLINPNHLMANLAHPDWVIIDCRFDLTRPDWGASVYAQGHIPSARYAHLEKELSAPKTATSGRHPLPNPDDFCQRLGAWGIRPRTQVIVYDDAGSMIAARLWWMLRFWLGHPSVAVLDGGLPRWQAAGYPLNSAFPIVTAQTYQATANPKALLSSAELHAQQEHICVIDARSSERFRGEVEPIDPIAGHIPGAINLPCAENVDSKGMFLPANILLERFSAVFAEDIIAHSCGSGVTACHNLLAMEIAGISGSKVYVGSWSEWITDPQRAVALGA